MGPKDGDDWMWFWARGSDLTEADRVQKGNEAGGFHFSNIELLCIEKFYRILCTLWTASVKPRLMSSWRQA